MTVAKISASGFPWLPLARILWVVLAAGYFLLWLISLPGYYQRASTLMVEPYRLGERVIFDNQIARQEAMERGMSLQGAAVYDIAFELFQILFYDLIAVVILWRARSKYGWFTAFVLMLMATTNMGTIVNVARPFPGAAFLVELPAYFIWPFWILWLYLFPNGVPVPPRTFLPITVIFAAFLALQAASLLSVFDILPVQIDAAAASLAPLGVVPLFGLILFSQVYRYRRVSTFVERQQTKWFLFAVLLFFIFVLPSLVFPGIYQLFYVRDLLSLVFLVFPAAVAIAILRYRLFDIDLIIRRTLVYGALTILLAGLYYSSVVLIQQIARVLTGQAGQSQLAIVVSTLGIAALFNPLRRRIQSFIDRRFYRQRYDIEATLQAFAASLRDEIELDQLSAHVVDVTRETMQPKNIWLWLKKE
jgi:hypothetical protein